ncbi:PH domain-containing protein [Tomitella biformata]|uniref:PH domain-containing protein n=1 Tax=Tomitella biformata TaxID=630403 RepID=UPI0004665CB6|nr:PH domain-containing protein [Tomitella biformata]
MAYPDRLLHDDEMVLWHRHPHWRRVAGPALGLPLLTLAAGVGIGLIERYTTRDWQLALYGLVGAAWLIVVWWRCAWPWLAWRRTHFVLTNQRLLVREGVLSRRGIEIDLRDVSDVSCRRSMAERLTGSGTLVVRSATAPPLVCGAMAQAGAVQAMIEAEVDALYH